MQALTHFGISKTKTLNSQKRLELFFSTIVELQPMRILNFDAAVEESRSSTDERYAATYNQK